MDRDDLTPELRLRLWRLALEIAADDVALQESIGRTFAHPRAAVIAIGRTYYGRLVDDDDFRIQQQDMKYGAVDRPPSWDDPLSNLEGIGWDQWIADGAPGFHDGHEVAQRIRASVYRIGHHATIDDAIIDHPWPRTADHYLDHPPAPAVALAIAEDLLARLAASHTGRDPDLAMRQGWDRRLGA